MKPARGVMSQQHIGQPVVCGTRDQPEDILQQAEESLRRNVAMMEQQATQIKQPEEAECGFAEFPAPRAGHGRAATVRFDRATLEVYSGANPKAAAALCAM